MKAIFMGDFQVYSRPNAFESNTDILDNSLNQLDKVFQLANELGSNMILHTGDFFEHQSPSPTVLNKVIKRLHRNEMKFPKITLYSITGNHDYAAGISRGDEKPDRTILQALEKAASNFVVCDYQSLEIDLQSNVVCLPFIRSENEWLENFTSILELKSDYPHSILLMHQDTAQEIPNSQIDENEVKKHFDFVVNGHIHRRKENGNWITAGSLLEQKGGDATETTKGVYVYDSFEVSMTFHEIMGYPKFVEYYAGDDVEEKDRGNYIIRRERPIEVKKSLRTIDDTTPKGREDAGKVFLNEKLAEIPEDLETELAQLTARVQGHTAKTRKKIRYDHVKFEGYRSWMHGEYELNPNKLRYIQAQTGAGKSTLFEALVWCEFGALLKEKAKQEHITPEKWLQDLDGNFLGTMVQVAKTVNDVPYIITRCKGYRADVFGQRGADNFFIHRLTDDGPIACTATDFNVTVEQFDSNPKRTQVWTEFCGIDLQTFLNVVIFTPEKCNLIQAGDAEKRAILEPLLQVDWVDQLKDLAKVEREKEQTEVGKIDTELRVLNERVGGIDMLLSEIQQREEKFEEDKTKESEEVQAKLTANQNSIPEFQSDIELWEGKVREIETQIDFTIPAKLADLNSRLTTEQGKVFELQQEVTAIDQKAQALQPIPTERYSELLKESEALVADEIAKKTELAKAKGDLEIARETVIKLQPKRTDRRNELETEIPLLEADVRAKGREKDGWRTRVAELESDIKAKAIRLNSLHTEAEHQTENCPVCAQKLPEGHNILDSIAKHRQSIEDLSTQIVEAKKSLTELQGQEAAFDLNIKTAEDRLKSAQDEVIVEDNKSLMELNEQKRVKGLEVQRLELVAGNLQIELDKFDGRFADLQILVDEQKQLSEVAMKSEADKLAESKRQKQAQIVKFIEANVAPIQLEISTLTDQSAKQGEYLKSLEVAKVEVVAAKDDLKALMTAIENQQQKIKEIADRKFDTAGSEVHKIYLEETNQKISAETTKKLRREKRIANLTHIEKTVCGAKGLKTFLIQQKLDQLNSYAAAYANALGTSIRFSIDDKNSYCTTLMIEGRERDAAKASNGQLLIANLILAGSLYDLQSQTVDVGLQMLDEPFGPLDQDTVFQVSQLLSEQSKKRSMHVITHSTSLDLSHAEIVRIEGGTKIPSKFVA